MKVYLKFWGRQAPQSLDLKISNEVHFSEPNKGGRFLLFSKLAVPGSELKSSKMRIILWKFTFQLHRLRLKFQKFYVKLTLVNEKTAKTVNLSLT